MVSKEEREAIEAQFAGAGGEAVTNDNTDIKIEVHTGVWAITVRRGGLHDPVTVYMQDLGESEGEMTVICWGRAWSGYWGYMGKGYDLRRFVLSSSSEYLAGKMVQREIITSSKMLERDQKYLEGILDVVKKALKQYGAGQ